MKRKSPVAGTTTTIDDLSYIYSTTNLNQLASVADAGTSLGFPGGTGSYVYDVNGNLSTDPYKGLGLTYNDLNKTNVITITAGAGQHIDYTYDGAGSLIRKQAYKTGTTTVVTDYVDGFVYIAGALSYFPMPEGRVLYNGTTFTQEFIITDQQGNARISFKNNGSNAAVVTQENSYYGYGMAFLTSTVPIPTVPNKQLYNGGSEWQNDYSNLPDYYQTFYRNYDAVLGRFVGVDPEPESAESLTTYNYAGGNPIMYNDPMGNYMFDPSKPGFNEQVGNMWTDPGMLSSLAGGGGVGGSIGSGGGGASGNGTDSNNEGGSNASFYPLYDAALTGDARAIEQYAAANAAYLPDGTIASYEVVRAQNYGVGVTGGPVYWQGTDSYNTKKSSASQGGYWSSLDWKGIGDATIGMLGGAGEIATASAAEVGSEGLSTAVSVPLAIDGWGRVGTNFNRLAAYFGGNKALGDALPSNIGGYVGKTIDVFSGVDFYSTGKGQAILGGTNDLLLIISPYGNAGAGESVLGKPNLWNSVGLGVSYYGGIIGLKNDVQSLPKR